MQNDYQRLISAQKDFFRTGGTLNCDFRIAALRKLENAIIRNDSRINEALYLDLRKCAFETYACETMGTLDEIRLAVRNLRKWSRPERTATPMTFFKGRSYVISEPYGTALVISAWNYPFQLSLIPLIGALAAGNCCVLKPSESAPHTAEILDLIISECFPKEYCAVVQGGVDETSALIKENFDFFFYTGGSKVGKIIARAAAEQLAPSVLEMGGKSPCIVDKDVDLELAARRIAWGKFLNSGQTCVAPDYVLAHKDVKAAFIEAMKKTIISFYGPDASQSPNYGRMINERHFDRVSSLITPENVVYGGHKDKDYLYIEPTLMTNLSFEHPVMREEIFGPVLPILEFEDISTEIARLKTMDKPLALYIFSKDRGTIRRFTRELSFGGGCVNATVQHSGSPYLPFGGVGKSGLGNYHGRHSFDTFSHKKGIYDKSSIIDLKIIYPPFLNHLNLLRKLKG